MHVCRGDTRGDIVTTCSHSRKDVVKLIISTVCALWLVVLKMNCFLGRPLIRLIRDIFLGP